MKLTTEHIQQLLIEKITGTINANDDIVIEKLMTENEDVLQQWEVMKKQVMQAEAQGFLLEGNVDNSWRQLSTGMIKPRQTTIRLLKMAAVAAVLTITITCI